MDILILIPVYNGYEYLDECIKSLKSQTYPHWKAIIGINGHSKPNSLPYTSAYFFSIEDERIDVIDYGMTGGKAETLNEMVENTTCSHVCLLDVDDKWDPYKLEKQVKAYEKTKNDVIGTGVQYFGYKTDIVELPHGNINPLVFFDINPIINSSCLIRREDAWWDPDAPFGVEDYDLWFRLLDKSRTFYNVPDILTYHRCYKDSYFNNKNNEGADTLRQKWTSILLDKYIK